MAQGRNTELATGMTTSSGMAMDSGAGAKSTGSTTMPGKVGSSGIDRSGMPNVFSNYTPPTAGSMVTKGGSGLRGGFGGFGGGGMFNKTR